uniref:RNA-directed DNA polymerase n=1 Tax=Caenorhabditis japonica TaxID=281687 RepID=A0A8R1IED0_CAEJA
MEALLGELLGDCAHVYRDDVLIASETLEQHAQDLEKVLTKIRASGMRLKASKCHLAKDTVEYLGNRISPGGVQTEEKKVEKMRKFSRPINLKELQSFLGLVGYYRKFVLNFAKIAAPLTPLTSKKVTWQLGEEQETAFQTLLTAVCQAPVLAQPDVKAAVDGTRPFLIYTDASRQGVGTVLAQENVEGKQHPIAFASKSLTPAETRFHITDLEAFAMIFALKRFKAIVYGTQIIIMTDHKPLLALLKGTHLADRLLRWSIELLEYNVKIVYLSGKANVVADMTETSDEGTKELLRIVNALQEKSDDTEVMNQENWLNHLKNSDEGWGELIHLLESGAKEGKVKIKGIKGCVLVEDYVIIGQKLRNAENPECNRKVVPETARNTVTEMHEGCLGGHFSAKKMLRQLSKRFFWPKIIVTMEKCVKGCPKCICTNDHPKLTAPLKPYETSRPLEIVAIDLIDVGLSVQGNRYILSIIDLFTKYGAAIPIPDNKAETVVKAFIDRWALGEGRIPEVLLSDQGKEFVNSHFEQLVKMLNIKHITTKGYNSRTNGCVERFNKTIMQILKKK